MLATLLPILGVAAKVLLTPLFKRIREHFRPKMIVLRPSDEEIKTYGTTTAQECTHGKAPRT